MDENRNAATGLTRVGTACIIRISLTTKWWHTQARAHEKHENMADDNVIRLHPEYENLKTEVERLRAELSMLILERDHLQHQECKNIEAAYMLRVGHLEYKAFQIECEFLRLKRKVELVQAKKNRQERVELEIIERILDEEFDEYAEELQEKLRAMNDALARGEGKMLTKQASAEIKTIYHEIVKALHPDLHPAMDNEHLELFHHAVFAYEHADLDELRVIRTLIDTAPGEGEAKTGFAALKAERARLESALATVRADMERIKSEFPYTMVKFVNDKAAIQARTREIEERIESFQQARASYENRLAVLLGRQP